jgi:hypothetical protein
VKIIISANIIWTETPRSLCNRRINWVQFQTYINGNICLNTRLKGKQELEEAVEYNTKLIQEAAKIFTPAIRHKVQESHNIQLHIKGLVYEKRRARRRWQNSRNSLNETYLNRLTNNLQTAVKRTKKGRIQSLYHRTFYKRPFKMEGKK